MKTRIVRDRRAGAISLSVRPQKGEVIDYALAEWLRGADDGNLLEFTYNLAGGGAELFFDLTGTETLPRYLKHAKLTSVQFQRMVCAVRDMLSLCTERGIATSLVRFDAEFVRVAEDGGLRFALVPLSGVHAVAANSPAMLLTYLSEHCTFVVAEDQRHAEALLDFTRRNAVLALSSLDSFLCERYGTANLSRVSAGFDAGVQADAGARADAGAMPGTRADAGARAGVRAAAMPGAAWERAGASNAARTERACAGNAQVGSARAAFDPISMLMNAPSAAEVSARQGLSDRVRFGVSEVSPTGASVASAAGAPVAEATAGEAPAAGASAAVDSVAGAPGFAADASDSVEEAPAAVVPSVGGTTLLGIVSPSSARASSSPAYRKPRERAFERLRDSARFVLPDAPELTLGRSMACDVVVGGNGNISRQHAMVISDEGRTYLQDTGSANGTFVAGSRLMPGERALLVPGAELAFADERFIYQER